MKIQDNITANSTWGKVSKITICNLFFLVRKPTNQHDNLIRLTKREKEIKSQKDRHE